MESIKSLVIYMYSFCNNTTTHPSCARTDSGIEACSYIPSDSQDPDSFIKYYVSFLHVIIFLKKKQIDTKVVFNEP